MIRFMFISIRILQNSVRLESRLVAASTDSIILKRMKKAQKSSQYRSPVAENGYSPLTAAYTGVEICTTKISFQLATAAAHTLPVRADKLCKYQLNRDKWRMSLGKIQFDWIDAQDRSYWHWQLVLNDINRQHHYLSPSSSLLYCNNQLAAECLRDILWTQHLCHRILDENGRRMSKLLLGYQLCLSSSIIVVD